MPRNRYQRIALVRNVMAHHKATKLTGPPAIELALGISLGISVLSRVLPVLPKYCAMTNKFQNLPVPWNEIEKNCDCQFIDPDARYLLK